MIAGEDFAIAAGCTRMSTGYEIISRNQSKLYELSVSFEELLLPSLTLHEFRTNRTVLASAGCFSDIDTLRRMLGARASEYEFFLDYNLVIFIVDMKIAITKL